MDSQAIRNASYFRFTFQPIMSEMDKQEEEEILDHEAETEDESEDESEDEGTDITVDDYKKVVDELSKARKKIAVLSKEKKATKDAPNESKKPEVTEEELETMLERRDFYRSNPDAKEFKDEIEKLHSASGGKFTRSELYAKFSGDDEIEENRRVYSKPSVEGKQAKGETFTALTVKQYDKLTAKEQKAYNEASKAKFGGVKYKD